MLVAVAVQVVWVEQDHRPSRERVAWERRGTMEQLFVWVAAVQVPDTHHKALLPALPWMAEEVQPQQHQRAVETQRRTQVVVAVAEVVVVPIQVVATAAQASCRSPSPTPPCMELPPPLVAEVGRAVRVLRPRVGVEVVDPRRPRQVPRETRDSRGVPMRRPPTRAVVAVWVERAVSAAMRSRQEARVARVSSSTPSVTAVEEVEARVTRH